MLKQLLLLTVCFTNFVAFAAQDRRLYSTVYVFNKTGDKVLLLFHKKFKRWAPPGGKIDPLELPDATAIREAKEETGVDITLCGSKCAGATTTSCMTMPYGMERYIQDRALVTAGYDEQDAYDYIYCGIADDKIPLKPLAGESAQLQWVSVSAIKDGSFAVREQERNWIRFFSEELKKNTK